MSRLVVYVLLTCILAGCGMRYGHIPRMRSGSTQVINVGPKPGTSKSHRAIPEYPSIHELANPLPPDTLCASNSSIRSSQRTFPSEKMVRSDPKVEFTVPIPKFQREGMQMQIDSIPKNDPKYQQRKISAIALFAVAVLVNMLALFAADTGLVFLFLLLFVFLIAGIFLARELLEGVRIDLRSDWTARQRDLRKIATILAVLSITLYGFMILAFLIGADFLAFLISVPAFLLLVLALIVFLASLISR